MRQLDAVSVDARPTTSMMEVLAELTPLNRVCCSSDYDRAIDYLCGILPFRVLEFPAVESHNGWVIPPKWDVARAEIRRDGRLVYDGRQHTLGVIAFSRPFHGEVDRDELRAHLHYDHRFDDALTFHFRQQFRSWSRDWGFCVPRTLFDSLEPGTYRVDIETVEQPGSLKILELEQQGAREETIALGANLDHPGVANDGLAGVVVGLEFMRRLARRKTKYSYRLVLVPGIIGSEYYLGPGGGSEAGRIVSSLFLEMLGSRTPLRLQRSRGGRSDFENAVAQVARTSVSDFREDDFGSALINDEYIWEAHRVPTASLSRFPYPEYHSSRDNLSIVDADRLEEAVRVLEQAVDRADASPIVRRHFRGTICLSNPRFDLYIDPGQVAIGDVPDERRRRMRQLMDAIPALDGHTTVRRLAADVGLPESVVLDYLGRWADKGLISLD